MSHRRQGLLRQDSRRCASIKPQSKGLSRRGGRAFVGSKDRLGLRTRQVRLIYRALADAIVTLYRWWYYAPVLIISLAMSSYVVTPLDPIPESPPAPQPVPLSTRQLHLEDELRGLSAWNPPFEIETYEQVDHRQVQYAKVNRAAHLRLETPTALRPIARKSYLTQDSDAARPLQNHSTNRRWSSNLDALDLDSGRHLAAMNLVCRCLVSSAARQHYTLTPCIDARLTNRATCLTCGYQGNRRATSPPLRGPRDRRWNWHGGAPARASARPPRNAINFCPPRCFLPWRSAPAPNRRLMSMPGRRSPYY